MKIRIRVQKVDPYGFCGRDRHPHLADEGQAGTVLEILRESADGMFDDEDVKELAESGELMLDEKGEPFLQVLLCRLDNGRIVELMDHEIVPLEFSN